MAFSRWDPLHDLLALQERISRLSGADAQGWMPPVDVYETPDRFVITAEVAGLSRDDIRIQIQHDRLTLSGERPPTARGEQYHQVERGHGQFLRTFTLPDGADTEAIVASLEGGVLSIAIPKGESERQRRVEVR